MATQRRPPSRRAARAEREAQRRASEIVAPRRRPPSGATLAPPAIGVAAGGTTFAGGSAAALLGVTVTDATAAAVVAKAVKAVLSTLRRIAALRLARSREALTKAGFEPGPIDVALANERKLEGIYQRRAAERLRAALTLASSAPDASARSAAIEGAFRREKNYARQRALASGARVFASIGQQALEEQSPLGAFWKLGIAAEHTPDCVAMAGKFWPWEILRRIHPLLHVGCKCRLYSYGEAISAGWMTPSDIMPIEEARRLAGPVIDWVDREHMQENEALAELLLREELAQLPGTDVNFLAATPIWGDPPPPEA